MGDESEQPKLTQRSNTWFFSKSFLSVFSILEEARTNMPYNEACSPVIQQPPLDSGAFPQQFSARLGPPQQQQYNVHEQASQSPYVLKNADQFKLAQYSHTQKPASSKMFSFQGPLIDKSYGQSLSQAGSER